jgi:putative acyl-CoA dehydrogenase
VIADLTLESEAATALAIRLAGAADRAATGDAAEAALLRLVLPAAKYWICKRTPMIVAEALECLGGNGYVEESELPRLLRDAPLNSIWEGSGNVTALDVLRAIARSPDSQDALVAELDLAAGGDRLLDDAAARLRTQLKDAVASPASAASAASPASPASAASAPRGSFPAQAQAQARQLAGQIVIALQAALLTRHAPAAVADAFGSSRLGSAAVAGPGMPFGSLPAGLDLPAILTRSRVQPVGSSRQSVVTSGTTAG